MQIKMLEGEYWWAGAVSHGHKMPFNETSDSDASMFTGAKYCGCDQFAPIMVSSKGRYFWSEKPFEVKVKDGVIDVIGEGGRLYEGFDNLRGAYLAACEAHFPFDGRLPDRDFFTTPQYNTWIELGIDQFQDRIIRYAEEIVANGFKPGILMIDGGWQEEYGVYEFFNGRKVPEPKKMVDRLHELGFKVMLWVSPIVPGAGWRFKELRQKNYLVKDSEGGIAFRNWWSGTSPVMDLSNPECFKWYTDLLNSDIENYGVDGFKFDAGDGYMYRDSDITGGNVLGREQTLMYNLLGEQYPLNEFRAAWKCGGHPIVARLQDKNHSWENGAFDCLIPHTIIQGLAGYAYCCPDMVGGGMISTIGDDKPMDEELFVRWAQANALMGMMQMSIAPWRVLSPESYRMVKDAINLHEQFGPLFYDLAVHASKTGEPIVRHMAYEFPEQGYEAVNDMFMLGSDYLVAPVVIKGAREKTVKLPAGAKWINDRGQEFDGGQTVVEDAPLDRLVYYKKI
ncbi:MAG: glycoside hydrolase [Clostridia bacterium]|nr:glycoside hydrolase [Clostridia bacterium]